MPRISTYEEHPLVSQRAKDLEEEELAAHVLVAEQLLGVPSTDPTEQTDCDALDAAVALQVTYQVESGVEGYYLQEARRGARHFVFRGAQRAPHLHRQALEMVRAVKRRI